MVKSFAEAAQVKMGLKKSLGYAREVISRNSVSVSHGCAGPPSMSRYIVVSKDRLIAHL